MELTNDLMASLRERVSPVSAAPSWAELRAQPDLPLLQAVGPDAPLAPLSLQAGHPLEAHRPPSSFVFVAD